MYFKSKRFPSLFAGIVSFFGLLAFGSPVLSQDSTIYVRLNSNPYASPFYIFSNTPSGESIDVTLQKGSTYTFIRSDNGHAFNIGADWRQADSEIQTSSNGTGGVVSGVASIGIDEQLSVTIPQNYSGDELTYFCYPHSTMKSQFNVAELPTNWDFDNNGDIDALTDGLLLMRFAFGLRDDALTSSAIASNSNKTSRQIQNSFSLATSLADIDGNGELDALTDGLLLLRYLFDLRGDSLVNSAIASDASRVSDVDIEAYIAALIPN